MRIQDQLKPTYISTNAKGTNDWI